MIKETVKDNSLRLDELYREFYTPIFRYLYYKTFDYDRATDIAQTAFLKYMKQNNGPKTLIHAQKLLFIIAKNLLIDTWRKSNNKDVSLDENMDFEDERETPVEELERKEDETYVREVLAGLKDIEKEIVLMRLNLDLSYSDISNNLGITEVNARKIYSRALDKVGQTLKNSNRF